MRKTYRLKNSHKRFSKKASKKYKKTRKYRMLGGFPSWDKLKETATNLQKTVATSAQNLKARFTPRPNGSKRPLSTVPLSI